MPAMIQHKHLDWPDWLVRRRNARRAAGERSAKDEQANPLQEHALSLMTDDLRATGREINEREAGITDDASAIARSIARVAQIQ